MRGDWNASVTCLHWKGKVADKKRSRLAKTGCVHSHCIRDATVPDDWNHFEVEPEPVPEEVPVPVPPVAPDVPEVEPEVEPEAPVLDAPVPVDAPDESLELPDDDGLADELLGLEDVPLEP